MGSSLYKIEDLTHIYDNRTVLNVPNLTFEKGKIHAITGPNGSGKTTLCTILGFLLKPTTGEILYQGRNISDNGAAAESLRKKVTMVQQNPFLFNTTVEKNVAYGLRVRKYPRNRWEPIVQECLKLMGIEHLRRLRATCLSGGETQRVAVARAIAINPEVLILDEFTANVDKNYVKIMEDVIQDIFRQKKLTIFLVTHDENQALRIADTSTHLIAGEIVDQCH